MCFDFFSRLFSPSRFSATGSIRYRYLTAFFFLFHFPPTPDGIYEEGE